jgi:hypothetical protein
MRKASNSPSTAMIIANAQAHGWSDHSAKATAMKIAPPMIARTPDRKMPLPVCAGPKVTAPTRFRPRKRWEIPATRAKNPMIAMPTGGLSM